MIIDRKKEIYYKVLTHTIMEAEQFHILLFASWRPRKTSAALEGLRENQWFRGLSKSRGQSGASGQEKMDVPAKTVRQRESVFSHLFVTLIPSTDWIMPSQIREDHMLISSRNTLTDTDTHTQK